jgi:hypothetical protein
VVPSNTGVSCRTIYQIHEDDVEGVFTAGSLLVQVDGLLASGGLGVVGCIDATFLHEHGEHL